MTGWQNRDEQPPEALERGPDMDPFSLPCPGEEDDGVDAVLNERPEVRTLWERRSGLGVQAEVNGVNPRPGCLRRKRPRDHRRTGTAGVLRPGAGSRGTGQPLHGHLPSGL